MRAPSRFKMTLLAMSLAAAAGAATAADDKHAGAAETDHMGDMKGHMMMDHDADKNGKAGGEMMDHDGGMGHGKMKHKGMGKRHQHHDDDAKDAGGK